MEMREQIEIAKRIIEHGGQCFESVECENCPFKKICDATSGESKKICRNIRNIYKRK